MSKKYQFGKHQISVKTTIEINLEDHFMKSEWDEKSYEEQIEWLTDHLHSELSENSSFVLDESTRSN
jgi:hypothetical protein